MNRSFKSKFSEPERHSCSPRSVVTLWTTSLKKPGIQADFSDVVTIQQPAHKPLQTQSVSTMWTRSVFTLQKGMILHYHWTVMIWTECYSHDLDWVLQTWSGLSATVMIWTECYSHDLDWVLHSWSGLSATVMIWTECYSHDLDWVLQSWSGLSATDMIWTEC
jgi:hypothetical protein